jgi:hypothetical protein
MKSVCLVCIYFLFNIGFFLSANQSLCQSIQYQAIVRNADGEPLVNQNLQLKFSILSDSISGMVIYSESHSAVSGELGWVRADVGLGAVITGTWNEIQWSLGSLFLQVEMFENSNWVVIGSQKLYAVPYSFHSHSADYIFNKNLPIFQDNIDAIAGGLSIGSLYRTATGILKVVF